MEERSLWEREAGSSNLPTPTLAPAKRPRTVEAMPELEALPGTDALRYAARAGVDLDTFGHLAATCGAEDDPPEWRHHETALRRAPGPIEELLDTRGLLVVPVLPAKGPRGAKVRGHAVGLVAHLGEPLELVEDLAEELVDLDGSEPGDFEDLRILFWPTAPATHGGHTGDRCEHGGARCWGGRVAATIAAGRWVRETVQWTHRARGGVISPPLLLPPVRSGVSNRTSAPRSPAP